MDATSDADDRDRRTADGTGSQPTRSVPASGADATSRSTHSTPRDDGSRVDDRSRADDKPRIVTTDPSLDQHQGQGVTGATWIALILGALVLIMLLIFILQNNVAADFAYLGWTFNLPLGVAMLFAAIAGVLVAALLGSIRLIKLSRRVRRLEAERESIKRALR